MPRQQEGRRLPGAQPDHDTPPRSLAIGIIPGHRDAVVDLATYRARRRQAGLAEVGCWWGPWRMHTWDVAAASRWPA
jgi:hypothetical protein